MSRSHLKNTSASVRARIANEVKKRGRPFQELLQHYGLERFLYRLGQSPHAGSFVLKGGLMLRVWGAPDCRPTRDIDLLGYTSNAVDVLEGITRATCDIAVEDDGLRFEADSVRGRKIKEDADYHGVRITFFGFLERARIPMQLDIGFGDVVYPEAVARNYPSILGMPSPRMPMYPQETVVAEKYEAMTYLGSLNTRLKDFFDIWLMSRQFEFDGAALGESIGQTFARRKTVLDPDTVALTRAFTQSDSATKQWTAFLRRSNLSSAPASCDELREPLRRFLVPVTTALLQGGGFSGLWRPGGPWVELARV